MIELLSKLINTTSDDHSLYLNAQENLTNMAVHFYGKDNRGKYLYCNDEMARVAGLSKNSDIIGQTDFDFIWHEEAPYLKTNDIKVISKRDPMIFIELSTVFQGTYSTKTHLLSYKKPLYSRSKKIVGIAGISIVSSIYEQYKKSNIDTNQWRKLFKISPREYDCLYYLAHGKSAKQIAFLLHISHRTVEEYLANAKKKLKCTNRHQLIDTIIKFGIL